MKKYKGLILLLIGVLLFGTISTVDAKETELEDNNTVYWDNVVNTGKDNGYSDAIEIKNGDPHYGWKLGKFALSGFTTKRKDENGNFVLLKNVGDEITLYFILEQDINKLNGKKELKIVEDKNGYDNEFGTKKANIGKGFLFIKKIESTNEQKEPIKHKNYLKGKVVGANTKIDIFEEGDYQVALDYEVESDGIAFFNKYNNYRIRFNFSIRNGNSMIFPFDVKTKEELNNTSITENGFYLDLANSKYLNVNIKREILKEGANGFTEDTRYNRPAKDKEEFTEEGIYTITVENQYTNEKTIKKIYVGKDKIVKAHIQTGRDIQEVREMVKLGATIDDDGNIENIPDEYKTNYDSIRDKKVNINGFVVISIVIVLIIFVVGIINNEKSIKNKAKEILKDKEDDDKKGTEGEEL